MSVQQGTRSDYTAVQFQRSNPNGGAEAEAMEDQRTNCQEHATAHERRWSWQTEGEATPDIAHRKGDNCTSGRVANLGGNFVGCQKHETSLKDVFLATSFSPPLYHQTLPFPLPPPHSLHFARSNVSFGGIDYSRVFESTRALRRMVQTLNDDLSLNGKTAKTDSSPESGQLLNSRRKLKHWDIEQRFLSWKICRRCRESPFFSCSQPKRESGYFAWSLYYWRLIASLYLSLSHSSNSCQRRFRWPSRSPLWSSFPMSLRGLL